MVCSQRGCECVRVCAFVRVCLSLSLCVRATCQCVKSEPTFSHDVDDNAVSMIRLPSLLHRKDDSNVLSNGCTVVVAVSDAAVVAIATTVVRSMFA